MKILSSGKTDIGMKRKTNQDSILLLPEKDFFLVADGMGGHQGGDIASQMSAELFSQYFQEEDHSSSISEKLTSSISRINEAIYKYGQENEHLKGMGTTINCLHLNGDTAYIGNVGDSRSYLIQDQKLYQLTRDHSLVQEKVNMGIYGREAAKKDPQKNILIRTIGFELDVKIDVYNYKMRQGDLFLLCSDGLHGKVSDQDILYLASKEMQNNVPLTQEKLDTLVNNLIEQANLNGGQDNISVILVYVA